MSCDFSYSHYKVILENALNAGYQFASFHLLPRNTGTRERVVYLRHDVDGLLDKAVSLAKIEAELGVQSTYLILVNSPFYNLFEDKSLALIEEIKQLGHWVGVHVDAAIMPHVALSSIDELAEKLLVALTPFIGLKRVVSFHRPDPEVLDRRFETFVSTYEPRFFSEIKYLSDSLGKWREGCPCEVLKEGRYPKLQLLMHPIWWSEPEQRDVIGLAEEMLEVRHKTCLRYLRTMEPFKSEIK
jgi:hydrogenase maturation factor